MNKKEIEQILEENINIYNLGEFFYFCDEKLRKAFYVEFRHYDDDRYELCIADTPLLVYDFYFGWKVNKYQYFTPHFSHQPAWGIYSKMRGDRLVKLLIKEFKNKQKEEAKYE